MVADSKDVGVWTVDERIVAPVALALSEAGGSLCLVLAATDSLVRQSWLQFSGDHALATLVFWVLVVGLGFLLGPQVWRKRRSMKNKLKFLALIWTIGVIADNALVINVTASITGGLGWNTIPTFDLVMRNLMGALLFWLVVLIFHLIDQQRLASSDDGLTTAQD